MKSEIEILREEVRSLRGRIEAIEEQRRKDDIALRAVLLQYVADIERRHNLRPHTEKRRFPAQLVDVP